MPKTRGQGEATDGSAEHTALATALLQAGERIADGLRGAASPDVHMQPDGRLDLEWLVDVAGRAQLAAAVPDREVLLDGLARAIGDGEVLGRLFGRLFPGERRPIKLAGDGKPILTPRQVAILAEVARDRSHDEIADRLGISTRTVDTHLERAYRRLGVRKSMQAVARAIALGYLDIDAISFIEGAANSAPRGFSVLHALLSRLGIAEGLSHHPELRRIAGFGLLLILASAAASFPVASDRRATAPLSGGLCRVDPKGGVSLFGVGELHAARGVAVAPANSVAHGFAPGCVYVLDDGLPQRDLNTAVVVQLSRTGEVRDRFAGGCDVATCLGGGLGLCFDVSGRMLAVSGWLTEAVLVLTAGGRNVERFAAGISGHLAVGSDGTVIGSGANGTGCLVLDRGGALLYNIGEPESSAICGGLAVGCSGAMHLNMVRNGRSTVEVFDRFGDRQGVYRVPGPSAAGMACDGLGRVYATCPMAGDVKVFTPAGVLERTVSLIDGFMPYSVAVEPSGVLWIAGQVA